MRHRTITAALGAAAIVLSTASLLAIGADPPATPDPGYRFVATAPLEDPRIGHTATLLPDGRVLVIGGYEVASAEIWDPATETWSPAGRMAQPREGHEATLLSDGRVLVSGGHGEDEDDGRASAPGDEIWDPATETFETLDGDDALGAASSWWAHTRTVGRTAPRSCSSPWMATTGK
jgi:hypothetical protein